MTDIILASTSPYRRQLMARLQIPFYCLAPDADETPLPGELPAALALRLALAKANSLAANHPESLIIGSDQVASIGNSIMGKPGTHTAAVAQLRASSGRIVRFDTALALVCAAQNIEWFHVEPFHASFRQLSDMDIEYYLQREQPYDCAGSFKCEGLGITLFKSLQGNDPTSLEGLPLIALTELLTRAGVSLLAS
ncbi:MAG: nucleoside triphosphate pyrophosphatase [Halioglobus sp.]